MAKNWIARAIPKSHRGIFSAKAKRAGVRDLQPARDAFAVTKSDTDDLPVYGKLAVFNAHATNAEVIRVVPVGSQDDTA